MPHFAYPNKDYPQFPNEFIEYIRKMVSEKGNFSLKRLLDVPIASTTDNNYKLRDYFDIEIIVHGITLERIKEIHPYPVGKDPNPYQVPLNFPKP
jgi:hypothetical protein